jgi:hypothetical protein
LDSGKLSYYGNDYYHGRAEGSGMYHRVVVSKAGRIRIAMLVDVDERPDLAKYDDYLSKQAAQKHVWTAKVVKAMRDVADAAPLLKQGSTLPRLSDAQQELRK